MSPPSYKRAILIMSCSFLFVNGELNE